MPSSSDRFASIWLCYAQANYEKITAPQYSALKVELNGFGSNLLFHH
jgi:hypothetical protein